jgi:hypothetical protein
MGKNMVLYRNSWYCALVILYAVTRIPNPLTGGRPAPTNEIGIAIMVFQIAYIAITAIILVRERRIKISDKEQLRQKILFIVTSKRNVE